MRTTAYTIRCNLVSERIWIHLAMIHLTSGIPTKKRIMKSKKLME